MTAESGPDSVGPSVDPSDVELQLRVEEIERSEERDRARALALFAGVLGGLAFVRWSPAVTGAIFVLVALAATGVGVFQVRRGQRKRVLEQELRNRRATTLAEADSPARRLVALHDELDRLEELPTGFREVVLLAVAACLFVASGVSEGITWVSAAGVFAGLVGLLRGRAVLARREEKAALREEIEEIEDDGGRRLPPESDATGGGPR